MPLMIYEGVWGGECEYSIRAGSVDGEGEGAARVHDVHVVHVVVADRLSFGAAQQDVASRPRTSRPRLLPPACNYLLLPATY